MTEINNDSSEKKQPSKALTIGGGLLVAVVIILFSMDLFLTNTKIEQDYKGISANLAGPNPDFELAEKVIKVYLESNSDDAAAHQRLGFALRPLNRPEEAKEEFFTALGLDSTLVSTYNNLGIMYFSAKRLR